MKNTFDTVNVLDVNITSCDMRQAVDATTRIIRGKRRGIICTPNPEIVMAAQKDPAFRDLLNRAELCLPDGVGVVIASKLLGKPLPERVAGYDFIHELFPRGFSFYLLGAKPGVAERAANNLRARYKGINILGTHDGYFKDDAPIVAEIKALRPDVLVVCMASVRQEKWAVKYRDEIDFGVAVGLGGTLDGIAGDVKRAPVWMQRIGCEWLYRVLIQPARILRLAVMPVFLYKVCIQRLTKK